MSREFWRRQPSDAGGRERGRNRLVSARGELRIQVKPEKETVKCGGLVYVDIALAGENKETEMNADTALTVEVTGGALLGFGKTQLPGQRNSLVPAFTPHTGEERRR